MAATGSGGGAGGDPDLADVEEFVRTADTFDFVSTEDIERFVRVHDKVRPLVTRSRPVQQLHGDAHPGNLLRTSEEWCWFDFEESVSGPVEWDIACLRSTSRLDGAQAIRAYGVDEEASLRPFREFRQLQGAAWYAVLAERFPQRRDAAREAFARLG